MNSNPMMQMMQMMQNQAPLTQNQIQEKPPFNPDKFKQLIPRLNDAKIKELAIQAQQRGISAQDIADGINFINSYR